MLRAVVVLIVLQLMPSVALAAERIALVIGNQAYNDKVGPLRNPHNDAALVGKALTEAGFRLLTPRKDAKRHEMLYAVYELAEQLRTTGRGAVGFVYYAGHGIAVGGENVLIPTDADNTSDATLGILGVRLSEIVDILKRDAPDAVHFVVVDACRTIRGRRGDRGFVPVNDRRTGVVIAFSTAPGETATDAGTNGAPYAIALAEEIVKPGLTDQVVFNAVRTRVVNSTSGQTPWTHDGLIGERVVFKATSPPSAPEIKPSAPARLSEAAEAWDRTKDLTDVSAFEAFLRRFGDTYYGDLAKVRLDALKKAEAARQTAEVTKKKSDESGRAKAEAKRDRVQEEGKKGDTSSIAGRWTWTQQCQGGSYRGIFQISVVGANRFRGSINQESPQSSGDIFDGRIQGSGISFKATLQEVEVFHGSLMGSGRMQGTSTSKLWAQCTWSASKG